MATASNGMTVVGGDTNSTGATIVRPQVVGVAAEQQRAIAEIQAALTVAKASRRDEIDCVDRITTACQRVGLAEKAEYSYSRGGSEITGATIDLLTAIANCWGNIQFGFRELTQANGESTVEAFAWDLETNSKRTVVFTVPHKRHTRQGSTALTDPRDIYELVANQAQRRVRACLEAIIPPDVLEDAVAQCRATLHSKADVTPESISKLAEAFAVIGVDAEQIQKRLGRRLDAMQPAQLISLRRIYKSIKDGMSKPGDWFEIGNAEPVKATAAETAKAALKKKATEPAPQVVQCDDEPPQDHGDHEPPLDEEVALGFDACDSVQQVNKCLEEMNTRHGQSDAHREQINALAAAARERVKGPRGQRSNQGTLV